MTCQELADHGDRGEIGGCLGLELGMGGKKLPVDEGCWGYHKNVLELVVSVVQLVNTVKPTDGLTIDFLPSK